MTKKLIKVLLKKLPKCSEEGGASYCILKADLCSELKASAELSNEVISSSLNIIEQLLGSFSLLDKIALENKSWKFISFPAQLMATSILTAMADSKSNYFLADFWVTNGITDAQKNNQRDILHYLEDARLKCHLDEKAQPIRFIYVAWSLIKVDGKFLFHLREDTKKRHNPRSGDYGLIGGRINQSDIQYISDKKEQIKLLQSDQLIDDDRCFENALKREIKEEIGLEFDVHYKFAPMLALDPYEQVEGAAPNHALTRYFFRLFTIKLTKCGYLKLNRILKLENEDALIWCTVDQMLKQECDGNRLYIQALHDHFRGKESALENSLQRISECNLFPYKIKKESTSDAIVFPWLSNDVVNATMKGSKHLATYQGLEDLSKQDVELLAGLAAHMRGFKFMSIAEDLLFLPNGWIDAEQNDKIKHLLLSLSEKYTGIIEKMNDCWFRLSVQPDIIFFDEALFQFSFCKEQELYDSDAENINADFSLKRLPFLTMLGEVKEKHEIKYTTKKRIKFFEFCYSEDGVPINTMSKIDANQDDASAKNYDSIRKWIDPWSKQIGLRKAIAQVGAMYKVCIKKDGDMV